MSLCGSNQVLLYCTAGLSVVQRVVELSDINKVSWCILALARRTLSIHSLLECFCLGFLMLHLFLDNMDDLFRDAALLLGS